MATTVVSIRGLNKQQLLHRLWENAKVIDAKSEFDWTLAPIAVKYGTVTFCGRDMRCNISGDEADAADYDALVEKKDAFAQVAAELRRLQTIPNWVRANFDDDHLLAPCPDAALNCMHLVGTKIYGDRMSVELNFSCEDCYAIHTLRVEQCKGHTKVFWEGWSTDDGGKAMREFDDWDEERYKQ
jgi:hypothetical protein